MRERRPRIGQRAQHRVDRGRLAARTWPGEQQQPLRTLHNALKQRQHIGREAQRRQVQQRRLRLEQTDHDLLAVHRRKRRNTHGAPAHVRARIDPPVAGQVALVDRDPRQHLHPGDQARLVFSRQRRDMVQQAVQPEPDREPVVPRFQVDVARALRRGFPQQQVDRIAHARVARHQGAGHLLFERKAFVGRRLRRHTLFALLRHALLHLYDLRQRIGKDRQGTKKGIGN